MIGARPLTCKTSSGAGAQPSARDRRRSGGLLQARRRPSRPRSLPLTLTTAQRWRMRPLSGGLTASGNLVSREEAGVASELAGYRIADVDWWTKDAWVSEGPAAGASWTTPFCAPRSPSSRPTSNFSRSSPASALQAEADRVKGLDNAGVSPWSRFPSAASARSGSSRRGRRQGPARRPEDPRRPPDHPRARLRPGAGA